MQKLIDGELHTRETVVEQYANLVYKHANRLGRRDYHFIQDLSQEGFIGLLDAFERYEADKGAKFITYATQYVRGYMTRVHDKRGIIHTPVQVVRSAWRIERNDLWESTDAEIAKELEISEVEARNSRIYFRIRQSASLDNQKYGDSDDMNLYGLIGFNEDYTLSAVEGYCRKMTDREKVIVKYFASGYTQAEIARELGLSKSRIMQHTHKIRERIKRETIQ